MQSRTSTLSTEVAGTPKIGSSIVTDLSIYVYMCFFGKIGINPHFYSAINKHIEVQVDTQHLYKEEKQHRSTQTLYCTPHL